MEKWEYLMVAVRPKSEGWAVSELDAKGNVSKWYFAPGTLNDYGEKGWELVTSAPGDVYPVMIFKRRKP
jgi:hypothetical protein